MTGPSMGRGTRWLIRLYPRAWRERYGDEFAAMLAELPLGRQRIWFIVDILRGAVDAHVLRRLGMRRFPADPALRRGLWDGLIVTGMIFILVIFTVVIFPSGPEESDSDPEYVAWYMVILAILALLLTAIGVRGARRGGGIAGGMKAGALAGAVIAVGITAIFLAVNNVFFDIVSQQHDKRVAFASSGWTSMRTYINVAQLEGGAFMVPLLAIIGTVLGLIGGLAGNIIGRGTGGGIRSTRGS